MVCCALCLLAPAETEAADFNVNAHTIGQIYEYVRVDGETVPRRRVTQYLSLNGYDLVGDGSNAISFQTSFRIDSDLGLVDAEERDLDGDGEPRDCSNGSRLCRLNLLYAYVEGKNLWNHWSFRVGRQLHTDVLGWYDFDGLWSSVRIWAGLHVDVYGGVEVKRDTFVLNDAAFDPDGTHPRGTDFRLYDNTVYAIGAALKWIDLTSTQARISYRRTFWHITSGVETDKLGAHWNQRLFDQLKFWGGAVFNFYITDVDFAEAGIEYTFADPDLVIAGEYYRQIPTFDADSIFNVFDVRGYDDARLRVGWQVNEDIYTSLRGGFRFYGSDSEYDTQLGSDTMVTIRGLLRWRPGMGVWTSLTHLTEFGLGGRKHYTTVGANTPWYHDLWALSGSLLYVNFDADYTTLLEGNAFGARLGGQLKLGEYGRLDLTLEEAINPFVKNEFRVYALLDLDFWF